MAESSVDGLYNSLSGNKISCIAGPADIRTELALISAARYLKTCEEAQVVWINGEADFDFVTASKILLGSDTRAEKVLDKFRILTVFDTHELVQELLAIQRQEVSNCMIIVNSISNLFFDYAARSGLSAAALEHLGSVSNAISSCCYALVLDNAIDPTLDNEEFTTLANCSDLASYIMGPPVSGGLEVLLPPSCPLTGTRPLCQCIDDPVDFSLVITPRFDHSSKSKSPVYITSVCKHRSGPLSGTFWLLHYEVKELQHNLVCIATNHENITN